MHINSIFILLSWSTMPIRQSRTRPAVQAVPFVYRLTTVVESLLRARWGVSEEGGDVGGRRQWPSWILLRFLHDNYLCKVYAAIGHTKASTFHSRRLLPWLSSCLVWNHGGPGIWEVFLPMGLGGQSVRPCVPWSRLQALQLI
jgi:hypothetical protein